MCVRVRASMCVCVCVCVCMYNMCVCVRACVPGPSLAGVHTHPFYLYVCVFLPALYIGPPNIHPHPHLHRMNSSRMSVSSSASASSSLLLLLVPVLVLVLVPMLVLVLVPMLVLVLVLTVASSAPSAVIRNPGGSDLVRNRNPSVSEVPRALKCSGFSQGTRCCG